MTTDPTTSAVVVVTRTTDERTRRLILSGTPHLSSDKETGPFMLFLLGDDLDAIANKTNLPRDIIAVTANHYRWQEKRDALALNQTNTIIRDVERNLLNNILMATFVSALKQVGDVAAGRIDAKDCPLIPNSMQGLQRLLEMVEKANGLIATNEQPPAGGTTVVHAENVQINQGTAPPAKDEFDGKRKTLLQTLYDRTTRSQERHGK